MSRRVIETYPAAEPPPGESGGNKRMESLKRVGARGRTHAPYPPDCTRVPHIPDSPEFFYGNESASRAVKRNLGSQGINPQPPQSCRLGSASLAGLLLPI